jgi:hypothetical protein
MGYDMALGKFIHRFQILAALRILDCMALEHLIIGVETMELVMRRFLRGALGSMGNGKPGRL